ncbi:MAG: ABA4-like family protein [Microcoleaceae cyanobacterium]
MTTELIFNSANIFVLPFWALIIFLPNWKITRKVMESFIPFVLLAALYLYLLISSITPESAAALSNPTLSDIAKLFGEESGAAVGWIHFLVMDLFIGRWIYWEGQRTGVWTVHSIILCLFAGPFGLLSHIITYWITGKFFRNSTEDTTSSSTLEQA